MILRIGIALFLLLSLTAVSVPSGPVFADTQADVEEAMICLCGCGQTIKNCPHENCGFAIPAKARIMSLINEGKTREEIIENFVGQYGEEVLSAPTKKGFNLLGYVIPFVALILAGALIMVIIRQWAARGMKDEAVVLPKSKGDFGSDIDKRIEKELEELD